MENNILKLLKKIKDNGIYWLIVLQPILDIIAYFQNDQGMSVAGYIRLMITCTLPLYALVKTKKRKKFLSIMVLIALFSIMHVLNGFRVGYIDLIQDIKYMLLVLHMPCVAISLIFLDIKNIDKQIPRGFLSNFLLITLVVIISYFTGTGNSTYIGYDYGWTGWFLIPNAQSIILVCLVPFALYVVIQTGKLWKILALNILIACMLIMNGTRTAYYSLFLISIGYIVYFIFDYFVHKREKFPFTVIGIFFLVLLSGKILYNVSPRASMDSTYYAAREIEQETLNGLEEKNRDEEENTYEEYLDKHLVEKFGYDRVINEYGEHPTAITFSDVRLKKRIYAKLIWEESDILTKMVGFQYPEMQFKNDNFDLENDPPAILYYYGYLGAALYVVLFLVLFIRIIRKVFLDFFDTVNLYNFALISTLMLQIAFAFNSGYLLRRPNVSFYLATIVVLCFQRTKRVEGNI